MDKLPLPKLSSADRMAQFSNKNIYILNDSLLGCPLVLIFVFTEFCGVFKRNGCNVSVITSTNTITNDDIVFMGDSFKTANPVAILQKQAPLAKYYGWYWHKHDTTALPNFTHIYENMIAMHDPRIRHYSSVPNSRPLFLRADEDPNLIGTIPRNNRLDYCYMGAPYCRDFVPSPPFKGIYHVSGDWNKYLTYEQRKKIYLSSTFALGFQSAENIRNKHVSQRIFEGLCYGCIVLTNSPAAVEQTDGIAVLFNSKSNLEYLMEYYNANPKLAQQKQADGYKFAQQYGTNTYALEKLL